MLGSSEAVECAKDNAMMKAISYAEFGDPAHVLHTIELPVPVPNPHEVRVRMRYAPIHNHDLWTIRGSYGYKPPLPSLAGSEGLGIIEEIGEKVGHLQVGQRVVASGIQGTWADYFIAPAAQVVPLPNSIPDEVGAQLIAMPLSTRMLLQFLDVKAGDWIVQNAANGAVGKTLAMLAKAHGVNTLNLVRREEVIPELTELGIDHVVAMTQPDWQSQVKALTDGQPIVRAVDSISGQAARDLLDLLSIGAVFVSFGAAKREPIPVLADDLIFRRISLKGFWGAQVSKEIDASTKKAMLNALLHLASTGDLQLPVDAIFSLEHIPQAMAAQNAPNRNGKVLFKP